MYNIVTKMTKINFLVTCSLFIPIEVLYYNTLGFSVTQITLLTLLIGLFISILELPTGIISDLYSRRTILILSQISFIFSMLILLLFNSFFLLIFANFFEALGWSFASGNNEAIVKENSTNSDFSLNLSNYYSVSFAALLICNVLVIFIMFTTGSFTTAILMTLILRIISLAIAISIKDNHYGHNTKSITQIFTDIINIQKYNKLLVIFDAFNRLTFFLPVLYQLKLSSLGIDVFAILIVNLFGFLAMYISQKSFPFLSNKFKIKKILIAGSIIQCIGLFLILSSNMLICVSGVIIVYVSIPIKTQITSLQKHEMCNEYNRAAILSSFSLLSSLFATIIFLFIGSLSKYHFSLAILVLLLLILVISLMYYKKIEIENAQ